MSQLPHFFTTKPGRVVSIVSGAAMVVLLSYSSGMPGGRGGHGAARGASNAPEEEQGGSVCSAMKIWESNSAKGEIETNGKIWRNNSHEAELEANGKLWVHNSQVGEFEDNGKIWERNSNIGEFEGNKIWMRNVHVGSIEADGKVWIGAQQPVEVEGYTGSAADKRAVFAYLHFVMGAL